MLDAVGLVHFGGRLYDQRLGRFVQADPGVPHPLNMQSYNRYSYVQNNPLGRVYPSGFVDLDSMVSGYPANDRLFFEHDGQVIVDLSGESLTRNRGTEPHPLNLI